MKTESNENGSTATAVTKRRVVSSLSPAKQRHSLNKANLQNGMNANLQNGMNARNIRPPLVGANSQKSSNHNKTKSSNLATTIRPPTKPPPLPQCSIALSQEETCLVSAAGDVLACRSADFNQLMKSYNSNHHESFNGGTSSQNNETVRLCDIDCSQFPMSLEKSSLCNPWLTRSGTQREEKKEDSPASHVIYNGGLRGGGSAYEWAEASTEPLTRSGPNGTFGPLDMEVVNQSSPEGSSPNSLRDPHDERDDEDRVLSMPSFDYSHFGNGGNDMLPASPARMRSRRPSDSAEIDVNFPPKNVSRHGEPLALSLSAPVATTSLNKTITQPSSISPIFHGVPSFLPSLSQVRIQQVSAHPRGSHVLMISAEALLFSYGLNDHGQLGIGIKSPPPGTGDGPHLRYVWTPTIITPLLENGGKATTCAAGESHSLVVVCTEGRRVLKSRTPGCTSPVANSPSFHRVSSSPPTMGGERNSPGDESEHSSSASSAAESVWHHQLYGFGRNNFMKIGLIHPQQKDSLEQQQFSSSRLPAGPEEVLLTDETHQHDMEDILLPHRVALHCTLWPEEKCQIKEKGLSVSSLPPQGIFALAASSEHSAALVRRPTGDIELYTWGNAAYHALGISSNNCQSATAKIAPVPTLVEQLSYSVKNRPSGNSESLLEHPEYPLQVALGPYSSFVVTSRGRCLSFGISYDGMLGHGRSVTEVSEPRTIHFPKDPSNNSRIKISTVSAGTGHVMALSKCGTVFTWGKNTDGRLGLGPNHLSTADEHETDLERAIEWNPQRLPPFSKCMHSSDASPLPHGRQASEHEYGPVAQICAGLDCSIFVTACGKVMSCGKKSGRLGLGEVSTDVYTPTPLFGGLSLWYRPPPTTSRPCRKASPSPAKKRPVLKRGMTTG